MERKSNDIVILGYGLAFIFGIGLTTYLFVLVASFFNPQYVLNSSLFADKFQTVGEFQRHAVLIWVLFLPQLIGAIAVTRYQLWGRLLLIVMNLITGIYIIYYNVVLHGTANHIASAYALISLIIMLFFMQPRVKAVFEDALCDPFKRILVVDDDKGLIKMLKSTLNSHGYEAITALTGEQGLQLARTRRPGLIFLDVILPGIKGRDVCMKLKNDPETRHIPVVFLTSKDSPDDVRAELAAGGIAHLTKPVSTQKLIAEIKRILG